MTTLFAEVDPYGPSAPFLRRMPHVPRWLPSPYGVSGELASRALQQAKRLGAEIVVTRRVEAIDPLDMTVTLDGGDVLRTKSIVLAMGVEWRRLEIDSVDRFVGSGVYYCAAPSDAGHRSSSTLVMALLS